MDNTRPSRSEDVRTSAANKIVILLCSDNKPYVVDKSLTRNSDTIEKFIYYSANNERRNILQFRLTRIPSHILEMVMEFCRKHSKCRTAVDLEDAKKQDYELKEWHDNFIKVHREALNHLMWAAQFFDIQRLINLTGRGEAYLNKAIILVCSDKKTRKADKPLALMSELIKNFMYHELTTKGVLQLHLPGIPSHVLLKVMEYCRKHFEYSNSRSMLNLKEQMKQDYELNVWHANFIKVDRKALYDLIWAAEFLKIKSLIKLTCLAIKWT